MRRLVGLFLLAAAAAFPAQQSRTVSLAELDQLLASDRGKSDRKVAGQIADLELSERAGPVKLVQWQAEFTGTHTREALTALADASAFLAPPAAAISANPPPDLDTQRTILSKASDYSAKTLRTLPDFSASRETVHFEDTPEQLIEQQSPGTQSFTQRGLRAGNPGPTERFAAAAAMPIHFTGRSSTVVTYRDGYEVPANQQGSKMAAAAMGLTSSGEFGPILSIVLGDAARGDLRWGYWQVGTPVAAAVFRYSVPKEQSHYTVMLPTARQTVTMSPAYHGEIAIDPETGTVLRIMVISDLEHPYQWLQIDLMVEYAPLEIGARNYVCPVKAIALSRYPLANAGTDPKHPAAMQTFLNDVSFTHYHVFRAESKILQ
jgi:hypothetical protein